VLPVFRTAWPAASARRLAALDTAIRLAEQSAENGRPAAGLKDAIMHVTMVAGVACCAHDGLETKEPIPPNKAACLIAMLAAKVAEWAGEAALQGETASANAALEAYTYARDAAHESQAVEVLEQLNVDLAALCRVAKRGGWSHATALPSSLFDLLSASQ
jgi:hypothetical protein